MSDVDWNLCILISRLTEYNYLDTHISPLLSINMEQCLVISIREMVEIPQPSLAWLTPYLVVHYKDLMFSVHISQLG